ncbi:MAG: hypothetical protein LAT82_04995 [Nanoarchaeota archaeon]|nr:hypothetical protein [Nanoarchaeota archaeon]
MNNKKSQIFIIDLILAFVIVVVTIGVIAANYVNTDSQRDLFDIAFRTSNSMGSIGINDLNNEYVRQLFIQQRIQNIDNTIIQQISDFYIRGETEYARNLTNEISQIYIPNSVGYNITLIDVTNEGVIFELDSNQRFGSREESDSIASIEKQIIIFRGVESYFHRYKIEVWRN